jgi:iron complex outermembrane receptor protein
MTVAKALAGAALLTCIAAPAQEPPAQSVEEIIVTAGFRESALMSSGASVSVINRDAIAERSARHLDDILALTPNVNFSVGGARARFVQMRGVGDLEQFVDPKHFPSVGIVLDGIELSNIASGALLFDSEQVEVLRGPQGTRFGASALAGLVNIRSREPGDTFEADFSAGYGNLHSWQVSAAAGGPLSDTLRARVAVRQNSSDGFIKNDFLNRDDTQNINETSARAKFIWDLSPSLRFNLTTLYIDANNGYDTFSLNNTRRTLSDQPGSDDQEAAAVAGRLQWDLEGLGRVELLTTWTNSEEVYGFDEDWVFSGFCDGVRCDPAVEFASSDVVTRKRDQASVDVRWLSDFGQLSWVTGAYFHTRDEDMQRQRFGLFASRYETHRYALYGQLEYAFTPELTARLGVRGEAFNDRYSDTLAVATESDATFWSGDATLEYQLQPATLLYATLSRGAKPGGVNTSATSVQPFVAARFQNFVVDRLRFETESLFNKELGIKGRYFDERVAVRLSVFHMDRSNAQLESWVWDAANFIFVGVLDNVDDAQNYGLELELDTRLTDALSLVTRVGYLRTNVEEMTVFSLDRDAFVSSRDRDQTKAPTWQYHFGLRWQMLQNLSGNVSIEGRDDSFFGYYHNEKLGGYSVLNASLAYRRKALEVRVWARNLLGKDYAVHGLYFANDPRDAFTVNRAYKQFGEPRVYGVELNWSF